MSVIMRILLFAVSVFTMIFVIRKLRKSQMQVFDVVFWLFFALVLVLMSIFADTVSGMTKSLGIVSPVNFVFLVVIFLLIIRCFVLSIQVSALEEKVKELVEELSVRDNLSRKETEERAS